MLVSLIRIVRILAEHLACMLLENCECGRREADHQAEAPGEKFLWKRIRHLHHHACAALISGRCRANPPRKEIAEAPEAREPNLHADVGDRKLATRQQEFGLVQPRLDPKLVRCESEQGVELTDAMK